MSRIIIKNLPKRITEERLRKVFGSKGVITDIQLKYTKDGVFRQFAFVGYKNEEDAQNALNYFNQTYLDASKIQVEICANLGDPNKPRSWSKYAKDRVQTHSKNEDIQKEKIETKNKKNIVLEKLSKCKDDPEFNDFLEVHKNKVNKATWSNDAVATENAVAEDEEMPEVEFEDSSDSETDSKQEKLTKKGISDLEYLKSKMVTSKSKTTENEENDDDSAEISDTEETEAVKKDDSFTVVVRNLPYKCKKKQVREFFAPLKPKRIRCPPKIKGIAYAQFKTEKDFKKALIKNKSCLNGRKIEVLQFKEKSKDKEEEVLDEKGSQWRQHAEDLEKDEKVADSGQLFVRNLCYTVTEDDLEKLFSKYGPLTEVNLPIDRFTRKVKGFAFLTFMFPEHAVKALTELDGTVFQGRLLHVLPGKTKSTVEAEAQSYKQKKSQKEKNLSSNSYNWNTLFLGTNAVVDAMAERYHTSKQDILNPESNRSAAVRVALGETQLIKETKDFLLQNGVCLDVFGQPTDKRSKTVFLVKNLPSKTTSKELEELFCPFGELGRIVLPPSGITALVEFLEPSEARNAFKNLAYSKFHSTPLYLEWAPTGAFVAPSAVKKVDEPKEQEKNNEEAFEDDNDDEPESDTTIFVKNLNFDTTESVLQKHFEKCGEIHSVSISKKKDMKNPGKLLSMGFGFIQFKLKAAAQKALKEMQHSQLEEHYLELKLSNRNLSTSDPVMKKKKQKVTKQKSSKILIRNIPFQAKAKEVQELFQTFGELKFVRLPRKANGAGHRGFGFVDFVSRQEAKRAFEALSASTHLYGRRLVLEWAEADDTVDTLRKKTAEQFITKSSSSSQKRKASVELEQLLFDEDIK